MRTSTHDMIGELRADVREAIGSMNDARDTVITIAARLYPDSPNPVPPRRVRGPTKSGS
ncbi:hypothetical protein [Devosia sp. 1566]|uniref:hypothetical protein n=1 Tax=Devosia sp. 1566 TaxID=2499144 RepID=UPI0013E2D41F|nr:hypothetical protein [Devosia sp. 1566]